MTRIWIPQDFHLVLQCLMTMMKEHTHAKGVERCAGIPMLSFFVFFCQFSNFIGMRSQILEEGKAFELCEYNRETIPPPLPLSRF